MTADVPIDLRLLLHGRSIMNIDGMLLFLRSICMHIYLRKTDGSCPLCIIEEDILLSNTIDVPPLYIFGVPIGIGFRYAYDYFIFETLMFYCSFRVGKDIEFLAVYIGFY